MNRTRGKRLWRKQEKSKVRKDERRTRSNGGKRRKTGKCESITQLGTEMYSMTPFLAFISL